jgi:hypothetical protein
MAIRHALSRCKYYPQFIDIAAVIYSKIIGVHF